MILLAQMWSSPHQPEGTIKMLHFVYQLVVNFV